MEVGLYDFRLPSFQIGWRFAKYLSWTKNTTRLYFLQWWYLEGQKFILLDVWGSVHHSIIHIENPTKCHSVSKFYFIFIWSSTCFGRHTAHHQEPKTAPAASSFACVEGCWTCSCWMLSGTYCAWQRPTVFRLWKTRGCWCSFRLLMMAGVSPETCWTSYKYEIKFWYTVASCWIFYMNDLFYTFQPAKFQ